MSKIVLPSVTGANNQSILNDNFRKIEDALNEGVLWRSPPTGEDNSVERDVDFNNKRIYNLPKPIEPHEPVRLIDVQNISQGEAIPEAPIDGSLYGRKNAEWSKIESSSGGGSGGLVGYGQYGPVIALVANSNAPTEDLGGYEGWRLKPTEGSEDYVQTLNNASEGFVLHMNGDITIPDGELLASTSYVTLITGSTGLIKGTLVILLITEEGDILPAANQPFYINVSSNSLPYSIPFPMHIPYRKTKEAYGGNLKLGFGIMVGEEPPSATDFRLVTVMTCLK